MTAIPGVKLIFATLLLSIAPAGASAASASQPDVSCSDALKPAFDPQTSISLIKHFRAGEKIDLGQTPAATSATRDLCLVKLIVGPGNPGPSDAPSTSRGIAIEIWLPHPWNGRLHVFGGGGFAGNSSVSSPTAFGRSSAKAPAYEVAESEGSVVAVTDTGHISEDRSGGGSFAMLPDGRINQTLWNDFARRGVHETAVKTKQLAAVYYSEPAKYSYFDGCSTGGRQGHMEAQEYPDDFDGILVGNPAINWTRFIPAELYPQLVMQRDLGGVPLAPEQLDLVSAAAVSACDTDLNGQHAGYISDPAACHYDPRKDRSVLCSAQGGSNSTAACVSPIQAQAIIKMWYGQTADGSVPDPSVSIGFAPHLGPKQVWFGYTRGTQLAQTPRGSPALAGSVNGTPAPFPIATDQVALSLQNPKLASASFRNATANGEDGWKNLSYSQLAEAQARGEVLNTAFAGINTDNPDLSRFKAQRGKMLLYYGMADQVIPIQGATQYYEKVTRQMGGQAAVRQFYRYYQVPGMGHCAGVGSVNGRQGVSPAADPPLPAPGQLFSALTEWVERGNAPQDITIHNSDSSVSRPLCEYPTRLKYMGGERSRSSSYKCQ